MVGKQSTDTGCFFVVSYGFYSFAGFKVGRAYPRMAGPPSGTPYSLA